MPVDIGMAFILVPHLDPGHTSMMSELLRRVTKLEVNEAIDGTGVKPNCIYVIPPNKEMSITNGKLSLEPLRRVLGVRLPIDSFFRSLADDSGEMAIGIILSGTGTDGTLAESLKALILITRECIEECRRIQMDLRPPMLDDLGLLAALSWLLRNFETTYCSTQVTQEIGIEEGQIPRALKIVIYRVTQETLNNVVKHSQATHVPFSLKASAEKIELTIIDNGKGFDVDKTLTREKEGFGLGLANMKERTALSGGTFSIISAKGKGTTIHASWPI
jgi:signal transduction histidine kinase